MESPTHDCCPPVSPAERAARPTASARDGAVLSVATSAGSIVTAFLASACCVGPLIFAMLGLGGAGLLVAFEPYRPYLMALTLALLGIGFYFTYRRPRLVAATSAVSADACDCPAPRTNRAGRVMLWVAMALVIAFFALPYVLPLVLG